MEAVYHVDSTVKNLERLVSNPILGMCVARSILATTRKPIIMILEEFTYETSYPYWTKNSLADNLAKSVEIELILELNRLNFAETEHVGIEGSRKVFVYVFGKEFIEVSPNFQHLLDRVWQRVFWK